MCPKVSLNSVKAIITYCVPYFHSIGCQVPLGLIDLLCTDVVNFFMSLDQMFLNQRSVVRLSVSIYFCEAL